MKPTLPDRFWSKVNKTDSCWTWTGAIGSDGYGTFRLDNRYHRAHRLSYSQERGQIPTSLVLDHVCYVRACVNPDHLQAVTRKQNIENRSGLNRNNSSGVRGVYWDKQMRKWRARVRHERRYHHVGLFDTIEDAASAVVDARMRIFSNSLGDRP